MSSPLRQAPDPRFRGVMVLAVILVLGLFDRLQESFLTVSGIRRLQKSRDIRALVAALTHPDADIQYEAVSALGEIRDPATVGPLARLFTSEGFTAVRWKVAEALVRIGPPAVEPLIAALSHPDDDVRWKAAVALGEIGDTKAIEPLIRLLSDTDRFVKGRAALALGMIGEPAVDPLIRALKEGDGNQRWGAAIALGRIKDIRAVEPLIRALADKYENVRAEAAASLAAIGQPAVAPLIRFLKYTDGTARVEVMNTLGDLQAAEAIEPLIQMLERATDEERRTIAGVLDVILTPSAEAIAKRLWSGDGKDTEGKKHAGE
ncbi:MAG: putative lyase [Methanoregula sp. PtaU1.Bin051]|nr:MAG: putative lyase [Methanoregula sp. PtaU1.Bin051]